MTRYYIFITSTGKKIPVKSKMEIRSIKIAKYFYEDEDIVNIFLTNFVNYLIAGGEI